MLWGCACGLGGLCLPFMTDDASMIGMPRAWTNARISLLRTWFTSMIANCHRVWFYYYYYYYYIIITITTLAPPSFVIFLIGVCLASLFCSLENWKITSNIELNWWLLPVDLGDFSLGKCPIVNKMQQTTTPNDTYSSRCHGIGE